MARVGPERLTGPEMPAVDHVADRPDLILERDPGPDLRAAADRTADTEPGEQQQRLEDAIPVHDRSRPQQGDASVVTGRERRRLPLAAQIREERVTAWRAFGEAPRPAQSRSSRRPTPR